MTRESTIALLLVFVVILFIATRSDPPPLAPAIEAQP